ncbi:hypothetical protein [Lentzea sp. NBRC 105346]|uniref:hypothetical protein n=1 Tax=Lentzea sp. NBRC 105346 TaxID=3032205 RepID=UPI002553FE57|nr:hypothetical protein [Lentzea sp. NBRC 105346]
MSRAVARGMGLVPVGRPGSRGCASRACRVIALDASADALGDLAGSVDVAAGDVLFDWSR